MQHGEDGVVDPFECLPDSEDEVSIVQYVLYLAAPTLCDLFLCSHNMHTVISFMRVI